MAHADYVDQGAYSQFRAGFLRHIGMEEKILLPAAKRLRGGAPLLIASKLRLDHGALATLLIPTPTAGVIASIRGILKEHNILEEGPGGLYETCDELAGSEAAQLLAKLQAAPEVTVLPHSDTPTVMSTVHRARRAQPMSLGGPRQTHSRVLIKPAALTRALNVREIVL